MKTSRGCVLSCGLCLFSFCPWIAATRLAAAASDDSPYSIVERGPHSRTWKRTIMETLPDGRTLAHKASYVELATGMHYLKDGQWTESKEEIELIDGTAVARQGQHQVRFAANLNSPGAIELIAPDQQRFRSHVLGIAYTDYATGQSVLIAETRDTIGAVMPPNQVIYQNAFSGDCAADVRYTYTLDGFEQDIILLTAPPSPAVWGLNPETTRIEVFSEFLESPEPVITSVILRQEPDPEARQWMKEPDLIDQILDFGTIRIGSGQAFPLGQTDAFGEQVVPTGKSFQRIDGRLFLIEKVDYVSIRGHLAQLPPSAAVNPNRQKRKLEPDGPLMARLLPARPKGPPGTWRTDQYAKLNSKRRGFVIDYVALNSSMTNYVLKVDTTFLITNTVGLYGTTVLEGAVLKFGTNGQLNIHGPLDCRTDAYRPATFLSKDDNTLGEIISSSTGTPLGPCGLYPLALKDTSATYNVHDIRVFHTLYGVALFNNVNANLSNLQVGKARRGVGWALNNSITCRNFLFFDLTNAFYAPSAASGTNRAEHGTIHRVDNFLSNPNSNRVVTLTNSLLISVTNNLVYTGTNDVVHSLSDTGFLQTVGGGAHYLANNSTNRNAGTTNINPGLLAELKRRTTEPPQTLFNTNFSANTILSPLIQGDTMNGDLPDLGYHYSVLDLLASRAVIDPDITVTATNGINIAIDYSQTNWGFILNEAKFISQGSATFPNRIVRSHLVQETGTGNPLPRAMFYDNAFAGAAQQSEVRFRFTELAQLSGDGYFLYTGTGFAALEWSHSSVYSPSLVVDISGSGTLVCGLTNTLWEGGGIQFGVEDAGPGTTVHLRNNLFRAISLHFIGGTTNWTVRDNLFDSMGTNIYDHGSAIQNSYNAYWLSTNSNFSGGISNLFLTNLVYETGPLGHYYQTATSPLLNAGSGAADKAALYHFSTATNQVRETNSIVDIGLHYTALDGSGSAWDTDGDSMPDYLEDTNGDGFVDLDESPWGGFAIGESFPGATWHDAFSAVPDTMGAIGPHHFLQVINGLVIVFNRTNGVRVAVTNLNGFLSVTMGGTNYPRASMNDPRVIYDHRSQRWFACAKEQTTQQGNVTILAVSNDSDPVGDIAINWVTNKWKRYLVPLSEPDAWNDYPMLGVDDNGVYVTALLQTGPSALAAFVKADLLNGSANPTVFTFSDAFDMAFAAPAVNFDPVSTNGPAWFVSRQLHIPAQVFQSNIVCKRLFWTNGIATLEAGWLEVPTPGVGKGLNAPQKGTSQLLSFNVDGRLEPSVIRNTNLWTCRNAGVNRDGGWQNQDRGACEWFSISLSNNTPVLLDRGLIFDPSPENPRWYYESSIMVNSSNDMVVGFSGSSTNDYVGAFYAGRMHYDPPASTRPVGLLKAGEGPYAVFQGRWGDYSATTLDPTDSMTIWTTQEYSRPAPTPFYWGLWIARIVPQ